MRTLFEPETAAFLEGGCAWIVGTVSADGAPYASRGWGADVLDGPETRLRLILDADDAVTLGNLTPGAPVALTATDVPTLHSLQVKGRAMGIEPGTPADKALAARFCDAFFTDINETDGTDRALLERLVPAEYVACEVVIAELYDQTPGPKAGSKIGHGARG